MSKNTLNIDWLELSRWLQAKKNVDKKIPSKLFNYDKVAWSIQLWYDLIHIGGSLVIPFDNTIITQNMVLKLKNKKFNDLTQADLPDKFVDININNQFDFDNFTAKDYTLNVFHPADYKYVFPLNNDWENYFNIEVMQGGFYNEETYDKYIVLPNHQLILADYITVLSRYFGGNAKLYMYPYYFIGNTLETTYFRSVEGVNLVCVDHPDFTLLTTYSPHPQRITWGNIYNENGMGHYFVVQSESNSRQPLWYFTNEFNSQCVELKNGVILLDECNKNILADKVRELNRRKENMFNYYRINNLYIPAQHTDYMDNLLAKLAGKSND